MFLSDFLTDTALNFKTYSLFNSAKVKLTFILLELNMTKEYKPIRG